MAAKKYIKCDNTLPKRIDRYLALKGWQVRRFLLSPELRGWFGVLLSAAKNSGKIFFAGALSYSNIRIKDFSDKLCDSF